MKNTINADFSALILLRYLRWISLNPKELDLEKVSNPDEV